MHMQSVLCTLSTIEICVNTLHSLEFVTSNSTLSPAPAYSQHQYTLSSVLISNICGSDSLYFDGQV